MALANFLTGATGMSAQAHSLSQISGNIANINTIGYKRSETSFATLLSGESLKMNEFSVKSVDSRCIDTQGPLQTTGNRLDIAINGRGFFIVNTEIDGTGIEHYTRAGDF
ncbi:MAG: flagellar hook basal-body protein, partial [Alphaproteobacteria bacterium]|nr:flagellar hook basal-body protein [Alphaproteobacteria bacterium]